MVVLLIGTAIYNGSLMIPGCIGEDLVGKSSMMSSPALNRSPLITMVRDGVTVTVTVTVRVKESKAAA
jgi:hypothetical protein